MLTVITAADSYDLCKIEDVKDEFDTSDATDTWLTRQITAQSKKIARYLDRVLAREVVTEVLRPAGHETWLNLRRYPVVDIASLVEDDTTLVEDTDFEVDYETGQVYRIGSTWTKDTKLTITYTGGYLLPNDTLCNLPEDIQQAAISLVRMAYFTKDRDPTLRSEEGRDLGSLEYRAGDMPRDVKDLLDTYRSIEL